MNALRIALLDVMSGSYARELRYTLSEAGHDAILLGSHSIETVETLLRRRGFTSNLSHVLGAVRELMTGGYGIVHTFTPPDAVAAMAWRRLSRRPVVFTCTELLDRATVADTRLRLASLAHAIEDSNAVVAADPEIRERLDRWFARSPEVLAAGDALGHERLYRRLLAEMRV